jgi:hypothetical protein
LNLFGSTYKVVWTPSLINSVFENSTLNIEKVRWSLLTRFFGADRRRKHEYTNAHPDASACLHNGLLEGEGPSQTPLTAALKSRIQECMPNLVSFSESIVDQNEWERAACSLVKPKYGHDSPSVEVSLFTLIRNFTGHVVLPTLVGSEFLQAYPSTLDDLWDLDGGFKYMILGLPRLLGIPSLTRAHVARRRLLSAMDSFHRGLDMNAAGDESEQPWRDLSDVGEMMTERSAVWSKRCTSRAIKASCDLSLLWA